MRSLQEAATFLPLQPATFHILLALADDDRHGYAIMQDVADRTDGALKLSAGTLYRSIQRMLEQGLIVEPRGAPRPRTTTSAAATTGSRHSATPWRGPRPSALPTWCAWRVHAGWRRGGPDAVISAAAASLSASFRHEYGEEMAHIFALRLDESSGGLGAVAGCGSRRCSSSSATPPPRMGTSCAQDLRHTRRTLARTPGFTVTAILIVALGVGATTAAFSVTDFVLFRPLPFPSPTAW